MSATQPPYRSTVQGSRRPKGSSQPAPLRRSPTLAAFLSFLVPGLGQLVSGRVRQGLTFLLPVLFLVALAIAMVLGDHIRLLGFLVRPEVLLGLFLLNVLFLIWRAAAIVDAWRSNHPGRVRVNALSTIVLAVLLLVTVGTHAVIGGTTYEIIDTLNTIFSGNGGGFGTLGGTPSAGDSGSGGPSTPGPTVQPIPAPLADGRLDILLIGGDAGVGRWSLRTDTLIVLSVDVNTGRAALFGIPRNLIGVPLAPENKAAYSCGCFPGLINALYVYASDPAHAKYFPEGNADTRGLIAVQGAISQLIGRQLDGIVLVKLQGFVNLVDAIGGIDINVPYAIHDSRYPLVNGTGYIVLNISKGPHHFNGTQALEFARSRHQDSDYGRMQRQQLTLTILAKKLTSDQGIITQLPQLLDIAKNNLWTNLSIDDFSQFVSLALRTDIPHMAHITFIPPKYPEVLTTSEIKKIQAVVDTALTTPLPTPTPSPSLKPTPTSASTP
ncbi:MAG: LCP family protein [Candidatus Limnocylindrales bacterium]